jgi:Tfp pilus assembly protein PilN
MSQQINLFDPQFRQKKGRFTLAQLVQAMVVVLLLSAVYYGYAAYQLGELTRRADEMAARQATEQAKLARFAAEMPALQSPEQLQAELDRLQAQVDAQQQIMDTLQGGEMGNTDGYSGYLQAFARQSVAGMWLTGFEIVGDGAELSLSGGALKPELVPAYIRKLGQEPVMRGKTFAALKMEQGKTADARQAARHVDFVLQSVAGGSAP